MKKVKRKIKSEINITPLTDVALMLLSIFMLTTPLLTQSGLNIELPRLKNADRESFPATLEVYIDKEGKIFVDGRNVNFEEIKKVFEAKVDKNENISLIIKADKNVKYEMIMKVIDFSRQVGIKKIALGVETEI